MVVEKKTIKYKDLVIFERVSISDFKRAPKAYIENEACFMFVNKGEFSIRTPNEFISFNQEKGMLAKCFDYFFESTKAQQNNKEPIEVIGILLYPSIVEELFQFDIRDSSYTINYNITQIQIDKLLNNYKESINILLDTPELVDDALIKTKLKEFILLISKTQNAPSQLDFLSAMFQKNDTDFSKTIANNLYANLTIDELAHLCGMSISTFKRTFKQVFNNSPRKYIEEKKLTKASELLASKKLRISDIAYDCGFETISTFNRTFKTRFGKSPSEYRLNLFA